MFSFIYHPSSPTLVYHCSLAGLSLVSTWMGDSWKNYC